MAATETDEPAAKAPSPDLCLRILADIAIAAVSGVPVDGGVAGEPPAEPYAPGAFRARWLAATPDGPERRRIMATADAAASALAKLPADRLIAAAARWGVAVDAATMAAVAEHFAHRRDAWLIYRR